jgi:hypothetical protein
MKNELFYGVIFNLQNIYEMSSVTLRLLHLEGYKIYKITNKLNGKIYIGDTKLSIYYRFHIAWHGSHFKCFENGDNRHLYNSMRKYGLNNFTLELLPHSEVLTESYYIKFYDSYYNGYNRNMTGKSHGSGGGNKNMISIRKDGLFKFIKTVELDYYLSLGWIRGHEGKYRGLKSESRSLHLSNRNRKDYLSKSGIFSKESRIKAYISRKIYIDKAVRNKEGMYSKESVSKAQETRNLNGKTFSNKEIFDKSVKSKLNNSLIRVTSEIQRLNLEINQVNWDIARKNLGHPRNNITYRKYLELIGN